MLEKRISKVLCAGLLIATAISIYFRVFYGWDIDESYHMLLAHKMTHGEHLFKELWDLHQLSVLGMAIVCKIVSVFTDDITGLGIVLRCSSVVFQVLLSAYTFKKLKRYYKAETAFLAAIFVANMLPRATQEFEYGTVPTWCAIVSSLILLDIYHGVSGQNIRLIVAAIFYSFGVLSYPTMAITVPFYIAVFCTVFDGTAWQKIKRILVFGGTCLICALIFAGYLLSYMPLSELLATVSALGKSGDHSQFFMVFTTWHYFLKSMTRLMALIVPILIACFGAKKLWNKHFEPFYVFALLATVIVIALNLTGLRPSGPFGFLERYIGVALLFLFMKRDKSEKTTFSLFYFIGLGYYLGALMASNLGFNENAMFLSLSLLGCVIMANEEIRIDDNAFRFNKIALYVFVFGVVLSAGYFVRINGTVPANVTQCSVLMEEGPLKGIYIMPEQVEDYMDRTAEIADCTREGRTYTIISKETVYDFYCKGSTIAASYSPTAVHNEQWIDFYEEFDHKKPDEIILDKKRYPEAEQFWLTEYGQYVRNDYPSVIEGEYFWILAR